MKILSVAPTRISLFGGGTDVGTYALKYGGLVLNMAINIRQQITMHSGDDLYAVYGSNVFPYNADPKFYYQILDEFGINDMHQTKLTCEFDGIIESGLGSSASAAVALIGAINRRKNLGFTREQIAEKAWELEVGKIGLFGGKQDQYAAALGGVNVMEFGKKVKITPLTPSFIEPLLPALVLFHTGKVRKSPKIQENLKELSDEQIVSLTRLKQDVFKGIELMGKKDVEGVGRLMDEVWQYKKFSNPEMTNKSIDLVYVRGLMSGAWGGKLLGSGGGGYILFVVDPKKRQEFIEKMGYSEVDFSVDYNGLEVRKLDV
jgi:D-glycero-alpha-D-manno-heptose-7-phosphate kinase